MYDFFVFVLKKVLHLHRQILNNVTNEIFYMKVYLVFEGQSWAAKHRMIVAAENIEELKNIIVRHNGTANSRGFIYDFNFENWTIQEIDGVYSDDSGIKKFIY